MIDKAQLESYRALAAKPAYDSVDASKALVALLPLATRYLDGCGYDIITELKAMAGL